MEQSNTLAAHPRRRDVRRPVLRAARPLVTDPSLRPPACPPCHATRMVSHCLSYSRQLVSPCRTSSCPFWNSTCHASAHHSRSIHCPCKKSNANDPRRIAREPHSQNCFRQRALHTLLCPGLRDQQACNRC